MTLLEVLISVKFFRRGDKIFQHFIFGTDRKIKKYLLDPRYKIHHRFKEKVLENSARSNFLNKREEQDRVVLEFENNNRRLENYYFTLSEFISNNPGCFYCVYKTEHDKIIYCEFMQKYLDKERKNCGFFREK